MALPGYRSIVHSLKNRKKGSNDVTDTTQPVTPPPQKDSGEFRKAAKVYLVNVLAGVTLVILAVFIILSIFWGSIWKTPTHPLSGLIVDFDQGQVGNATVQALTSEKLQALGGSRIHWMVAPASQFPGGVDEVVKHVFDEKTWVALVVNSNASSALLSSVDQPNPSYNPKQAITVYAVEARNENAYRSLIYPTIQGELTAVTTQFSTEFVRMISSANLTQIAINSPQTIAQAVDYQLVNIRPFDVPVATAVTFVGLLYVLILSFFLTLISHNVRRVAGIDRHLSTGKLVLFRLVNAFVGYFFLSLFYSLLSRAFQLPFERFFGRPGFLIFWMLNYVGMLSLGLALESMLTLLTEKFIPFFMLLWIITNVSVTALPIELLPRIFHFGYAMPFYNISKGIRTIVFGTHNELPLNFGILIVWATVSCITLALFQTLDRKRHPRELAPSFQADLETAQTIVSAELLPVSETAVVEKSMSSPKRKSGDSQSAWNSYESTPIQSQPSLPVGQ